MQGENHYRKRIREQKFSSALLRQRRRYICGLLPPARANGTKREAIWYSELYLSLVDRYANYPKEQGLPQKDEVLLRRRSELYLFRKGSENRVYGGDELRRF